MNVLKIRHRLRNELVQQRLLLTDDLLHASASASQLRRSVARGVTSPLALGIAGLAGFAGARKMLAKPRPATQTQTDSEPAEQPRRSVISPLLINLLAPVAIGWLTDRLIPLLHNLGIGGSDHHAAGPADIPPDYSEPMH
jgi:hypothetical protein